MKVYLTLTIFCFLVSCKTEISKPDAPKDVLSQREMVSLTKELLLMESHLELSFDQLAAYYKILNSSSDHIFKKHHISRERYTRSFDYFAANQDKMTGLYQEILDSLNIEKHQ